jgi:hypothetical protein
VESVDSLLRAAIADKRLISFTLDGRPRVGEPHDYGVIKGVPTLFFYQTGGESNSAPPRGWRSGRHTQWDELFATVSPRD